MVRFNTKRSALAVAVFTAAIAAPPVYSAALEEVIVTARKREENLQQVPAVVNVFTATSLQDRQVSSLVDLASSTPNVTMADENSLANGSLTIFIRGVGNDPGFDQGVGVYLDDVFLQQEAGLNLDVYDVERIEVLKGPQGNLYGRNTIGGAIKYITKDPSDTLEGHVEAKIGSYNQRQVKAQISGPLVQGIVDGSLAVSEKKRDGIETNIATGEKIGTQDAQGARGALKITPTDSVTVKLTADYTFDNSKQGFPGRVGADLFSATGPSAPGIEIASFLGSISGFIPPGSAPSDATIKNKVGQVSTELDPDFFRLRTNTEAATISWELNDSIALKSVTAHRAVVNTFADEFGGTAQPGWLFSENNYQYDDLTQEFQMNYTGDGIDAVAGAFYVDGRQNLEGISELGARAFGVVEQNFDAPKVLEDLKSFSFYGNADIDFGENWHASVGGRLTRDEKTDSMVKHYSVFNVFLLGPPFGTGCGCELSIPHEAGFPDTSKTWRNFSPAFKLSYDISENTMAYVGVSSGFKAGGFNSNSTTGVQSYDPEKVRSYTLGYKATTDDGKLRFNTEAFYNDYTDKQLAVTILENGSLDNQVKNVGKAHTTGVEFETNWLTPLDGLQVDLNVGYLDAKMDKYKTFVGSDSSTAVLEDVASHTSLGFSPNWTVGTRISYTRPIADLGDLMIAGDANFRSSSYTNTPVDRTSPLADAQETPQYTIFNAIASFRTADEKWRLALEGKNLTNKRVVTNTFVAVTSVALGGYNDPRTFSLTADYYFK